MGDFYEGMCWVEVNEKQGYIDATGKEVIPLIYDRVGNFENGKAPVGLYVNKPLSEEQMINETDTKPIDFFYIDKKGRRIYT